MLVMMMMIRTMMMMMTRVRIGWQSMLRWPLSLEIEHGNYDEDDKKNDDDN